MVVCNKKKYCKRDWIYNLIIISVVVSIMIITTRMTFIYGSYKDWAVQHYAIPEYFRQLFYDEFKLFPQFSMNLGAGQNIYYYSYYGLFNPIILFSYLLPFVSMRTYIIASMILIVIISILLFYRWIFGKYGSNIAFIATMLFALSSPLIFHSHRHIMFIDYMPFLIMSLIGVERYFQKKKSDLLICGIFLMILTSFFFSVSGILAVTVYAISYWIDINEKKSLKDFVIAGISYAFRVISAVMLSGFLLIPTAYTILNGRPKSRIDVSVADIFIPNVNVKLLYYGHYSMGLTAIFAVALVFCAVWSKKGKRFIAITMVILSYMGVFSFALNGMMYMDGKVFIPFLPLGCLILAEFFKNLQLEKIHYKKLGKALVICNLPILVGFDWMDGLFLIDLFVTYVLVCVYIKRKMIYLSQTIICLIAGGVCIGINLCDEMIEKDSSYIFNENDYKKIIDNICDNTEKNDSNERGMAYRIASGRYCDVNRIYNINQLTSYTYSSSYNLLFGDMYNNHFYNEDSYRNCLIFGPSQNQIYNMYMGNKYIIDSENDSSGYECINTYNDVKVYENQDVRPIAYFMSNQMSSIKYNELDYPYNVMALYNNVIVDEISQNETPGNIDKWNYGELSLFDSEKILDKDGDHYNVEMRDNSLNKRKYKNISIPVPDELQNKVFFVSMTVDNKDYIDDNYWNMDVTIYINNVCNKLSDPNWKYYNNNERFEYTICSNDNIKEITISLCDGNYIIYNPEIYYMDYEELCSVRYNKMDDYIIGNSDTDLFSFKDNVISGTIECDTDGYFMTSIPYDDGFELFVDGTKTEIKKVDIGFLGCELEEGKHSIRIIYQAPWFKPGIIMSIIGLVNCIGIWLYYLKFKRKYSKL